MWKWLAMFTLCAGPGDVPFGLSEGGTNSGSAPRPGAEPAPQAVSCSAERAPDRTCASDSDCAIVWHTVSCCGTQKASGVNRADVARFQEQDRRCNPGRRCGCAPGPTLLDDGTRLRAKKKVAVACREHLCTTFVEPLPASEGRLTSESVKRLPTCPLSECGPAPAYPNRRCPDGVSVEGRGPCVRINGRCGWAHLTCP